MAKWQFITGSVAFFTGICIIAFSLDIRVFLSLPSWSGFLLVILNRMLRWSMIKAASITPQKSHTRMGYY